MLKQLRTSRSATFYKTGTLLPKAFVESTFRQISQKGEGRPVIRIVKQKHKSPMKCEISFIVFKFHDEPSFFDNSGLKEVKFAFLLMVQTSQNLIVIKKHIDGFDQIIQKRAQRHEYETIQFLFSSEDPSYEKMALSSMGISKAAILRKTLESDDLKGQLSAQSVRRSIPTSTTVRTRDHRHVLRPTSSSISKTDSKSNFTGLMKWINDICGELAKAPGPNAFLSGFAQPVKFDLVHDRPLRPTAVLLNLSELKSELSSDASLFWDGRELKGARAHSFLNRLESNFDVGVEERENLFRIQVGDEESRADVGFLKLNNSSFSLRSKWLKKISIKTQSYEEIDLERYLNKEQHFTITFDTPEYVYLARKIFRDQGIIKHCDEIVAAMETLNFSGINDEKGPPKKSDRRFPKNSVFNLVEKKLSNKNSALLCDDLGDEWADYVKLSRSPLGIALIHCKFGKPSTSASQLHEVVGQALKNIGRTSLSPEDIDRKLLSWATNYTSTKIKRVRSKHSSQQLRRLCGDLITSPVVAKEINLVVPFLSKGELVAQFKLMGASATVKPHLPQLVWLLSTFVAACKETGAKPVIICSK
ncbi:MAG: hypothetical protein J0L82_12345 [Deltaproteobacteria bacterium]|nr:hypothetical protein [Deltaproteobacteria bacterium]